MSSPLGSVYTEAMGDAAKMSGWLRRNWFLPLFAVLLAIEFAFARFMLRAADPAAEAAVLFDLCVVVPALYAFCYRRTLAPGPLLMRTAALACLGLYVAAQLVPAEAQRLIAELSWLRYAGWAVLAAIELWLAVAVIRLVFGGATTEQVAARSGTPLWVARLMLLEARFWKAVWRFLRRP